MTKRRADMTPEELERTRAQARKRRHENPEAAAEATRKWRAANLDAAREKDREAACRRRAEDPEGVRATKRAWAAKHAPRLARRQREWLAANPERALGINLRAVYGHEVADYDARYEAQGGLCAICDGPGPRRGRERLNIDHDHATGAVRALLCGACNKGLGHFRDKPEIVDKAAAYLRRFA